MKTKKLVFTSIFIALCFVATTMIKLPIPIGSGYVHLGDALVMLSGMLLGPFYGGIAAGLGSGLADYSGGFVIYVIPTILIKGLLAFLVGLAYNNLKGSIKNIKISRIIYHAVVSIIVVTGGYFLTDFIFAQFVIVDAEGSTAVAYAAFGLPWNTIQVTFGIVFSILLYVPLKKPFESMYE